MSKKYQGKPCVYCADGKSTKSGDHIFPRKMFLERRRGNLPKVACCTRCNNRKSQLEHYLLTVLPFGASHDDALENLKCQVPGRLSQNISLHEKLYEGQNTVYVTHENGVTEKYFSIPFDPSKLTSLFNYISRALAFHHFGTRVGEDDLSISRIDFNIDSFVNGKVRNKVDNDLGNGTVIYTGVQALDSEMVTAWEYLVYGGLKVDNGNPKKVTSITGPKSVLENAKIPLESQTL